MDIFPEDFTREACEKELRINQELLIKDQRQMIYEAFTKAKENCEQYLIIKFNKKLWYQHRKRIVSDILIRFGVIKVVSMVTNSDTKTTIALSSSQIKDINSDIPENIQDIIIEFSTN